MFLFKITVVYFYIFFLEATLQLSLMLKTKWFGLRRVFVETEDLLSLNENRRELLLTGFAMVGCSHIS
mgnify:FL=1